VKGSRIEKLTVLYLRRTDV